MMIGACSAADGIGGSLESNPISTCLWVGEGIRNIGPEDAPKVLFAVAVAVVVAPAVLALDAAIDPARIGPDRWLIAE